MHIRYFEESDGKCFARFTKGCAVCTKIHSKCGTYFCKFYKPMGCKDWIRIDGRYCVKLYTPEEVEYGKDKFKAKGSEV